MKETAAVREWALEDGKMPTLDLTYDEDISFDGAVLKAKRAKELKQAMVRGIEVGFGRYIAELSTVASVEHGGIAKFAKQIGMNYATMKKHRSRYLEAGQKRKYVRKRDAATLFSENGVIGDAPLRSGIRPDEIVLKQSEYEKLLDMSVKWEKLSIRLNQVSHQNRKLKRQMRDCPYCGVK